MKNIIELYKIDIKRILENKSALFLAIALCIVPSLYALFNIAAIWDPYGRTENLEIAIYSDDQKQVYRDKDIQIGSSIVKSLQNNKSIKWVNEESKDKMVKGVRSGKYYAGIYIPRTFSKDILSFTDGNYKKPKIEYYSNQKINAIASKISDTASNTLVQNISKNFTETVSSEVISQMNKAGVSLEENIPMIRKASDLVFAFEKNEGMIDSYAEDILMLQDRLPEINAKINDANAIIKLFPEINSASSTIMNLNMRMDDVERVGELLNSLKDKRDDLQFLKSDISQYNNKFNSAESALNDSIVMSQNMLELIDESTRSIDRINSMSKDISSGLADTSKFISSLQSSFGAVKSSMLRGLDAIDILNNSIVNELGYLAERVDSEYFSESSISSIKRGVRSMQDNIKRNLKLLRDLKDTLEKLQSLVGDNSSLNDIISRIDSNINIMESMLLITEPISSNEALTSESIKSEILKLQVFVSQLNDINKSLKSISSDQSLDDAFNKITDMLNASSESISSTRDITPKIYGLLDSSKTSLRSTIDLMKDFQRELPLIREKMNGINDMIGMGVEGINTGIEKALRFYAVDFPIMKKNINKVSDFIAFELPGIEKDIEREINSINKILPKVNNAVNLSAEFIENDYPKMKDANKKIANFLRDHKNSTDLKDAMKILKSDAAKESEFLVNPVELVDKPLYPIPNYGSASAPFYIALSLWVGALLLSSVTTTEVKIDESIKGQVSSRQTFISRLLTYITFGIIQALIVSVGCLVLLGTYSVHPFLLVLTSIFIAKIFMSIVYSLVKTLGNIGKGIAIIILVLSISAGGGNFPPELTGKFFRLLNPILPFTYAVNILRETVGGIYVPNYIIGILALLIFGGMFVTLGMLFHKNISAKLSEFTDKAKDSHFFS